MLMVISGQFGIITTVLLLWIVQDLTYAPGWAHPVFYYFAFAGSRESAGLAELTCAAAPRSSKRMADRRSSWWSRSSGKVS
jgi:hypothetical protein